MSFNEFVFTFGVGVVAGAVLTLLYAPMSGKKLHKKIFIAAGKVIDRIDDLQQSVRKIAHA